MNKKNSTDVNEVCTKYIGVFIVVVFSLLCVFGLWKNVGNEEKPKAVGTEEVTKVINAQPIVAVKKDIVFEPKALLDAFTKNEVKITHELEGKNLILNGRVKRISISLGKPVIAISVPDSYDDIRVFFNKSMTEKISELEIGDHIQVRSDDVSLNPFGTIHLRDSSILTVEHKINPQG